MAGEKTISLPQADRNTMSYKDYRISSDTSPEAQQLIFELLAKKSAVEKLHMVAQMNARSEHWL